MVWNCSNFGWTPEEGKDYTVCFFHIRKRGLPFPNALSKFSLDAGLSKVDLSLWKIIEAFIFHIYNNDMINHILLAVVSATISMSLSTGYEGKL